MRLKLTSFLSLAVAVSSFASLLTPAQAFTPLTLTQTFNNPTPEVDDRFGNSVSIDNTNALIGSVLDDAEASNVGAAYVFHTIGGNLLQTFSNPNPQSGDFLGNSVSISGVQALIGARLDDAQEIDAGSAYLVNTKTGILLQTFNNPTPETGDEFGNSVSINNTKALIGSYLDNTGTENAGSTYLFNTETGSLLKTFNNPTPQIDDNFGFSVSIEGIFALMGANRDDTGAVDAGSAYLFNTETGNLLQTFNNPTPQVGDEFGYSVSISNTYALIGTRFDDTGANDTGSAYLFDIETGNLLQTFNNPTPEINDQFGFSVSLSGTYALIGARFDNTWAESAGSAYLFDIKTGNLLQTINNPIPETGDEFGYSVSLSNANALIGVRFDNTGAESAGSAYLYQQVPESSTLLGAGIAVLCGIALSRRR